MSWRARAVLVLALLAGCRIDSVFETDVHCDFDVELGPDAAVAVVDRLLGYFRAAPGVGGRVDEAGRARGRRR